MIVKSASTKSPTLLDRLTRMGNKLTDNVTATHRLATCKTCPQLMQFKVGPRCVICGCFVTLKVKLASERCPMGKW